MRLLDFNCATSQRGRLPRPVQVSERLIRIAVLGEYRRVRPTPLHWNLQLLQALFQLQFFLLDFLLQQLRDLNVQRP
jgi:cell division protein FtsB